MIKKKTIKLSIPTERLFFLSHLQWKNKNCYESKNKKMKQKKKKE